MRNSKPNFIHKHSKFMLLLVSSLEIFFSRISLDPSFFIENRIRGNFQFIIAFTGSTMKSFVEINDSFLKTSSLFKTFLYHILLIFSTLTGASWESVLRMQTPNIE